MSHVVLEGESVEVLDCVEFDDPLRQNDVLADLSFLIMELQFAGREDLSRTLVKTWHEAGGPLNEKLLDSAGRVDKFLTKYGMKK